MRNREVDAHELRCVRQLLGGAKAELKGRCHGLTAREGVLQSGLRTFNKKEREANVSRKRDQAKALAMIKAINREKESKNEKR